MGLLALSAAFSAALGRTPTSSSQTFSMSFKRRWRVRRAPRRAHHRCLAKLDAAAGETSPPTPAARPFLLMACAI